MLEQNKIGYNAFNTLYACLPVFVLFTFTRSFGSGGFGVAFYSVTNFFADILENGNNSCILRGYLEKK